MISIGVNFASSKTSIATGDPTIQVGGENLMHLFLSKIACSRKGGRLHLASPYISRPKTLLIPAMRHLDHRSVRLNVYTGSNPNAENGRRIMAAYPWQTTALRQIEKLHAKMFLWAGRDGFNCALIGSQNLTRAGFYQNAEAGVLIGGHKKREVDDVLSYCTAHLRLLATGSHTQI